MSFHRLTRVIAGLFLVAGVSVRAADDARPGLRAGEALPGPFQVLDATGEAAGRFHCTVCTRGLRPTVLVFFRDLGSADSPLAQLFKGLDESVAGHRAWELGATGVWLADGAYQQALEAKVDENARVADQTLTKATNLKDERLAQLAALARDAKLVHVVLGLAVGDGPRDYRLSKEADVTVILYSKYKVLDTWGFPKGKLDPAAVKSTLRAIDEKVAATTPST